MYGDPRYVEERGDDGGAWKEKLAESLSSMFVIDVMVSRG
jgi:hypothetical protein